MWWQKFDRLAAPLEELADDIACLSWVQATGAAHQEKQSLVQTYVFSSDEETKLTADPKTKVMFTHEPNPKFCLVRFDDASGKLDLKIGTKRLAEFFGGRFPERGALIPDEFVSPKPIPAAIRRAAQLHQAGNHPLLEHFLERKPPLPN